jgi:hypothetical protein
MRTLTGQQDTVLALPHRSTHWRVSIDRGSSDWVDMTTLENRNWCKSLEYGADIDNSVVEATVLLHRAVERMSLAPLVDGSKLNASGTIVDIGNPIKVEVAVMPIDMQPASGDWVEVFRGEIDQIEWQSSPIKLLCRDQGGQLDAFIETQSKRPFSTTTDDVEDIMQEILDSVFGASVVDLYSPNGTGGTPFNAGDTPGWVVTEYIQRKQTVQAALRVLADQIGWHVRYLWHANTSAFQLQFYDPGRELSARGTLTLTGQPLNNETFVVNATTFTAKTSGAGTDEFDIETTLAATGANIVAMLNAGSESGNLKAWYDPTGSTAKVRIEWLARGVAGNSVTFTEALSNATADGSGTLGGTVQGQGTTVARTFSASQYHTIDRMSISRANIRNVVRVKYGLTQNDRTTIEVSDSASITKYGRKFMELAEAANSQIDSISEAYTLANAIIDDLKEPDADKSVTMPYFWPVDLADYYTFSANNVHYDTNQSLAVVGYRHTLTAEKARTQLMCRGKPAGGVKRWLSVEARGGIGGQNDFYNDEAASGVTPEATVAGIIVTYDDPRTMSPPINDWAITKCYVDDSGSGFTPSDSNLKDAGRRTRFEITGLTPGATYYCKLQIIDSSGNVAATSSFVSVATQMVGPYHINPDREYGVLVPNQDFGAVTLDPLTNMPDYWSMVTGSYGASGDVESNTTVHKTGNRSIEFRATGSATPSEFESDYFPVSEDDVYLISLVLKRSGSVTGAQFQRIIRWYNSAKTYLSSTGASGILSSLVPTTTWKKFRGKGIVPPANARFAKLRMLHDPNSETYTLYCDSFSAERQPPEFSASKSAQSVGSGSWTTAQIATEAYDYGGNFNTGTYTFTAPEDGIYMFEVRGSFAAATAGTRAMVAVYVNGSTRYTGGSDVAGPPLGGALAVSAHILSLSGSDTVVAQVYHNEGSNLNVTTDFTGVLLSKN